MRDCHTRLLLPDLLAVPLPLMTTTIRIAPCNRLSIVTALEGTGDTNEHVVDVEVVGSCTTSLDGVSAIGARVTAGGACWQHTHPHMYNVYDFTSWPTAHQGGQGAITQFATGVPHTGGSCDTYNTGLASCPGVAFIFPNSHDMSRWRSTARPSSGHLVLLGRLGDALDFRRLPSSAQTSQVAALVGSAAVASTDRHTIGFEACGSPGEVANVPELGNDYNIFLTGVGSPPDGRPADRPTIPANHFPTSPRDYEGYVDTYNEKRTRNVNNDLRQDKNVAWTMMALNANDQLRQRVAWYVQRTHTQAHAYTHTARLSSESPFGVPLGRTGRSIKSSSSRTLR